MFFNTQFVQWVAPHMEHFSWVSLSRSQSADQSFDMWRSEGFRHHRDKKTNIAFQIGKKFTTFLI